MDSRSLAERLRTLRVTDPLAPENRSPEACARRLLLAAQMSDDGVQLKRAQIRRDHPDLSEEEVLERLHSWLHDVPPPGFAEEFFVSNPYRFQKDAEEARDALQRIVDSGLHRGRELIGELEKTLQEFS